MDIEISLSGGLSLEISDAAPRSGEYPTSRIQKGWLLKNKGVHLAEEAVGFGVPVLKRRLATFFPGTVRLEIERHGPRWLINADFGLNLVEKIVGRGGDSIRSRLFYLAKNTLAAYMMTHPPARGLLTSVSTGLRRIFGWETTYEDAGLSTHLLMRYGFDEKACILTMEADLTRLPASLATQVIVMNEQGARYFDQYWDAVGTQLSGNETGFWDEVVADEATFASSTQLTAFTVYQVSGARLFRGRELIGSRLAWVGFGHTFPPTIGKFACRVKIEADA